MVKNLGFDDWLIAPCGMNCGICRAHLRENRPCPGCRHVGPDQPKSRAFCRLKLCEKQKGPFCFSCEEFPCALLIRLDNRYVERYGMSEIANLEYIRDRGLNDFIAEEESRWISSDCVLCVHDRKYYKF
jgi:hypothetical protein